MKNLIEVVAIAALEGFLIFLIYWICGLEDTVGPNDVAPALAILGVAALFFGGYLIMLVHDGLEPIYKKIMKDRRP